MEDTSSFHNNGSDSIEGDSSSMAFTQDGLAWDESRNVDLRTLAAAAASEDPQTAAAAASTAAKSSSEDEIDGIFDHLDRRSSSSSVLSNSKATPRLKNTLPQHRRHRPQEWKRPRASPAVASVASTPSPAAVRPDDGLAFLRHL